MAGGEKLEAQVPEIKGADAQRVPDSGQNRLRPQASSG